MNTKKSIIDVTTYETYESTAKHLWFFDNIPVRDITAKTVDKWLLAIKRQEYLNTQHRTRIRYRAELQLLGFILPYFSECIDESYQVPIKKRHYADCVVDRVKHKKSKKENKERFIPRQDFERFLVEMNARAVRKPDQKVYHVAAEVQLGGETRIGETCALKFEDVHNWNTGEVYVSENVQWSRKKGRPTRISPLTQTGEPRTIWLSERALMVLKQWRLLCGRSKGLIFSLDGINPIAYRSVQHHYDEAFKTLGMKWNSTHIMRHSYATDFLDKTKDKSALQKQLGHSSSKQTDHYASITADAQRAGVIAYNERLRGENVVDMFPQTEPTDQVEAGSKAGSSGVNES